MATNRPSDTIQNLLRYIDKGLAERAEAIYEDIKQEMIDRLEKDKAEIITKTVIYLTKQMDVQTMTDRVIITVRNEHTPGSKSAGGKNE